MGGFTDTHIHIWDLQRVEYAWLEKDTSILKRNYALEQLDDQRLLAGVEAGILVQAACNRGDTDLMLEAAARHSWIKGIVGWVPLMDPTQAARELDELTAYPVFKGIRHLIHDEPDTQWLLQDTVVESLRYLSARNIPYDLVGILPEHLRVALKLLEQLPGLRIVIDHLNQPPIASAAKSGEWFDFIREIARNPNVYAKISGLGTTSGKPGTWGEEDVLPYVEYALEHFGPQRCMCGGDWPVSLLAGSYPYTWNVYEKVINRLITDPVDLQLVRQGTAAVFYGLEKI